MKEGRESRLRERNGEGEIGGGTIRFMEDPNIAFMFSLEFLYLCVFFPFCLFRFFAWRNGFLTTIFFFYSQKKFCTGWVRLIRRRHVSQEMITVPRGERAEKLNWLYSLHFGLWSWSTRQAQSAQVHSFVFLVQVGMSILSTK